MPEPRPRSPAQIAASRRNGARSKGPVTEEGKERASRNALKHGLTSMHHLVLEDEVPDALEALIATVPRRPGPRARSRPGSPAASPSPCGRASGPRGSRPPCSTPPPRSARRAGFQWEEADPLTTFDLKRFNAIRGYQAQQGREISRCLKELRLLRKDALAACTGEPDVAAENEPKSPPVPTNDNARPHHMLAEAAAWHTPKTNLSPTPGARCGCRATARRMATGWRPALTRYLGGQDIDRPRTSRRLLARAEPRKGVIATHLPPLD